MSALLLAALVVVTGASATAQGRVRTIAEVPSPVSAFAHSGRYLAWLAAPSTRGCPRLRATMQDLHTGARVSLRERCSNPAGVPGTMVLAGGDAYWEALSGSNTLEWTTLVRASTRTRKVAAVDYQSIFSGGFAKTVPPASDGRSAYFWTSPEDGAPGPIFRFDDRGSRRMTSTIRDLTALGAGEGRWAFARAERTFDCAQEPAWYPAGRIAFASDDGRRNCRGGIWVVNANGRGIRRLVPSGRNPDWSPASELAFDDRGSVKVLSDGSAPRVLIGRGTNPSWHPDGTSIAFERDDAIVVADGHGAGERVLLVGGKDPDWSPDGSDLVFARTDKANPGLSIVRADGTGLRTLTSADDTQPAWSPDGRSIAFVRCTYRGCATFGGTQIYVVAPDGTEARRRTEDSDETYDSAPSWGPDSRLAFARSRDWQDDGDSHIFTLSGRLTRTPTPQTPVVVRSGDGRTLARLTPGGEAVTLAVTRRLTAAVTRGESWKLELLRPKQRSVTFRHPVGTLSASGHRVVLLAGRKILLYDIRTRKLRFVARVSRPPIGLSIAGRRIAWAENVGKRARIRSVTLAR